MVLHGVKARGAMPVPIQFGDSSGTNDYRTCAVCGSDCVPEAFGADDGSGLRIAFFCPEHGVHSVVDPFERLRGAELDEDE